MIDNLDWDAVVGVGSGSVATAAALRLLYARWSKELEEIRDTLSLLRDDQRKCERLTHELTHEQDIRITRIETRHELDNQRRDKKTSRETN